MSIAASRAGDSGVVCYNGLDENEASMLRAMGLRPRAMVRVCRVGEPCIVEVVSGHGCACRIGLSGPLARHIYLAPACES